MFISPLILANTQGIPRLENNSVSVTTTGTDPTLTAIYNYTLNAQRFLEGRFVGLLLLKLEALPTVTGTVTSSVINITINGDTMPLVVQGGTNATETNIPGGGIYLVFYDSIANLLQLV